MTRRRLLIEGSLWFLFHHVSGQEAIHLQRKSNHISIAPMSFDTYTMFAVTVDEAKEGEQAIVDVCYYTTPPGLTKLVLCKTSVVPVFGGVTVATEGVPVTTEEIHSVKVQIVRTVNYANFSFKGQAKGGS